MTTFRPLAIAVSALCLALPAWAQLQSETRDERFAALDRDNSGALSLEEYATEARTRFDAMDVDHNFRVTAEELETAEPQRDGQMSAAQRIALDDDDEDGELSADEHAAVTETMFERADANDDGSLAPAEFKSGYAIPVPTP
jgi:Ca2+-binding EF-hand superfamily protein